MYGTMTCDLFQNSKLEGTLLTKEQVEEISTRISKNVSENVSKQLEEAISALSSKKTDKETKKKMNYSKKKSASHCLF